tara:strand:+ start:198 stop:344 length:147 start_codon:yes stop_codon:yes gene_type:complete
MILAFVSLLVIFPGTAHVEKTTTKAPEVEKIKYIKIPTEWVKVAKKSI